MARRKTGAALWRWLGAIVLIAVFGGGALWWHVRHWTPDRKVYPVQGVQVGSADGTIDWPAVKAIGADFVYLDASASAFARDPAFTANLDAARQAKLQVGAVHRYDPCQPADRQAANFVTVVPRDPKLLPPAVELDQDADNCPVKVSDAFVESELMTFINQVETHTGKAVILKMTRHFQGRYHLASAIDRNLWLVQDRIKPEYAGRPWTMWTANHALPTEAGDQPLEWVVVQP